MKTAAQHALETESAFLAGVQARLKHAGGRLIAGREFKHEERDDTERLRAAMIDRRIYDRARFDALPHGRGFTVRGYERRFIFGKRLRSVTVASVIAPPGPLLEDGATAPPVSLAEVTNHIRGLVTDSRVPHLIGVCSPSGFDGSVYETPLDLPNVRVVLIAPRPEGGWLVKSGGRLDERLLRLFDPEDFNQKAQRIRREIDERRIELLTGAMSASDVARRLDLPQRFVEQTFEQVSAADRELRVSRQGSDVLLFRGAAVADDQEDRSMSLAQWIRNLFSSEGEEGKKINVLAERRAALSRKLDQMYEDIGRLEKREEQLCVEGKAATSKVVKRRLASQIAQSRKDISRCNTSAAILSKQINIISTHIHNLELAETGSIAQLPTSEELTEAAVNAEEILEQLTESDDLVSGLEVSLAQTAVSEDEAAILKELEGEAVPAAPAAEDKVAEGPTKIAAKESRERGPAQAE